MAGCVTRCTTFSKDSIQVAWTDIRAHFGPIVDWSLEAGSLAATDVATWTAWATAKGIDPSDVTRFGKWLIWLLSYGTVEYGNLPTRIRDHVGISCIPCPYDTSATPLRTRLVLGLEDTDPLPTQSDHGIYYMKVSSRGGTWGFECTSLNCPFYLTNGIHFFHV
jgi:hypothetical protein